MAVNDLLFTFGQENRTTPHHAIKHGLGNVYVSLTLLFISVESIQADYLTMSKIIHTHVTLDLYVGTVCTEGQQLSSPSFFAFLKPAGW